MNPSERLRKLRTHLVLDEQFFGGLLLSMPLVEDPRIDPPTMCTNGRQIRFHPEFVAAHTDPQLKWTLCHEVMHPSLLHPWRMGDRDLKLANMAGDYVINNILDDYIRETIKTKGSCSLEAPDGILLDHSFDGQSFEELYATLARRQAENGDGAGDPGEGGQGQGQRAKSQERGEGYPGQNQAAGGDQAGVDPSNWGQFEAPEGTDDENAKAQEDWQVTFNQALNARGRGNLPAGMRRLLDELLNPELRWPQYLMRWITDRARDDFSWRRPNKRFLSQGIYLPGLDSDRLGTVVMAWDSSGSVGQDDLKRFVAEGQGILDQCRPTKLVCMECDAAVHHVWEFEPGGSQVTDLVELGGGGGTSFKPVFDKVEELGLEPVCLVFCTDLDGALPDDSPPYPVLWVSTRREHAPFGEVIKMTV